MSKSITQIGGSESREVRREFVREQAPLIILMLLAGVAAGYLQHGYLPGADRPFPLAGVAVPIWHLVWMGCWTGYTMAVVGNAAGLFALPYTISVLQFSNVHVTPTTLLLTFLNPFGALFGFWRNHQWSLDLAVWVSLGGIAGGLTGPFLRLTVLSDVEPFTLAVGFALIAASVHLCISGIQQLRGVFSRNGLEAKFAAEAKRRRAEGLTPAGLPKGARIKTTMRRGDRFTVQYWGVSWTLRISVLIVTGFGVGIVSSSLGVGGGFLLVPIFVALYGIPVYVLVAATIPYVIVLSATSLFSYGVVVPWMGGQTVQPEWAWGFFAAAGGILGSWAAAKTQKYVPESFLRLMLGGMTAMGGAVYVVNFFYDLSSRL